MRKTTLTAAVGSTALLLTLSAGAAYAGDSGVEVGNDNEVAVSDVLQGQDSQLVDVSDVLDAVLD